MMKKVAVITLITMFCFGGTLFAQAPQILNFQGQLNDSSGNPVADGDYAINFLIYDADTGGNLEWSSGAQTVTVTSGVFNVMLNNVTLDLSSSTYYLTMQVGSDSEMSPRQRITSVVYAMNANTWLRNGNHIYFDNISGNVGIGTTTPSYKLHVNGTIRAEGNDIAEPFDMTDIGNLEMGDVVVIDPQNPLHVTKSQTAYDTMVAGIVSSNAQAGYIAGGRSDGSADKPVALVGRVLCKVSAENGPIQLGDLLTTSNTPGYAMKATEKDRMTGALLGKALQAFDGKYGTIMVLVALQ